MSAQCFLLEQDDLNGISWVGEHQETIDEVAENFGLTFEVYKFWYFVSSLGDQRENRFVFHLNKQYSPIYLPIPKSPPELI